MIVKLISLILLLTLWAFISTYFFPNIGSYGEKYVGLWGITQRVQDFKNNFQIPEFTNIDTATQTLGDTKETLREGIDLTKDHIDTVRQNTQKLEEGYKNVQETVWNIQQVYEQNTELIENIWQTLQTGSWSDLQENPQN